MTAPACGVCRYCGCTETTPCVRGNGDPCAWLTAERDVCNGERCVKAHEAAQLKAMHVARAGRPRRKKKRWNGERLEPLERWLMR